MKTTIQQRRVQARAPRPGSEGSALILTVSFILLAGMVTGALISAAVTHRRMADRSYQRERAFHVAEAGLEAACQVIAENGDNLPDPYTTNGTLGGAQFFCTIDRTSSFTYAISSTGIANNVKWVVRAKRVEQPSWAKYALWMDINGSIYFVGGEEFYGHVHSNTKVYFSNTGGDGAHFYDRMTTATNTYGGSTNGATFAYGLELNADQDSMASVNFTNLYNTAVAGGIVVTGHTFVTLTGTIMRVTNQRMGWTNHSITVGTNNIMYVKTITSGGASTNRTGRLMISGRADGRITFVTEEDVMLRGHLTYATHPTNPACSDAIGLVSKDDIWVDTTMPDDAQIHAAMMATGQASDPSDSGSFGVVNHSSGSPRGDLNVWGSIVQEVRGAVGTFNSYGISSGYAKMYGFDQRFLSNPPPYYPRLSSKLTLYDWREGPPG